MRYLIDTLAAETLRKQFGSAWLMDAYLARNRPTLAQWTAYQQDITLRSLTNWCRNRLMDLNYRGLERAAFDALYTDPALGRKLGQQVEAARDAVRDIANEDTRALVLAAWQGARRGLHEPVTAEMEVV